MSVKLDNVSMELLELDSDDLTQIAGGLSLAAAENASMKLYIRPPTLMERINCAEHGTSC